MGRPAFIVSASDVPEQAGRYPGSDEALSFGRAIGRAAGLQRIGLHVERVPPGCRTSWPHAEEKEEEFVYVLDGEIDAWIDGEVHRMTAGDLAAFPAGTGICHTFLNQGTREARLLVGGESSKPDNRIFYPLHPVRRGQMVPHAWWDDCPRRPLGSHDAVARPEPDGRPSLKTQRLVLRPPRMEDAADLARAIDDPAIARNTSTIPHPYTIDHAKAWISSLGERWAAGTGAEFAIAKDGAIVGAIGLSLRRERGDAGVGYWIAREHWNRGYATEALRAVIDFAFGPLGLRRVHSEHFVQNPTSGRVMRKAGMTRIGVARAYLPKGDVRHDCVLYEIVRS